MNRFSNPGKFEKIIIDIADYVFNDDLPNQESLKSASFCLIDSLGCGLEALEYEACKKLLGPIIEGTTVPNGARVPGTNFKMDPIQATIFSLNTCLFGCQKASSSTFNAGMLAGMIYPPAYTIAATAATCLPAAHQQK